MCLKPNPDTFLHVLDSVGVPAAEAIHVGDAMDTDVLGARTAGMKSILFVPDPNPLADYSKADACVRDLKKLASAVSKLSTSSNVHRSR